ILTIEHSAHEYPWTEQVLLSCNGDDYLRLAGVKANEVCGYVIAQRVACELTIMNIPDGKAHQGQGLGYQLLESLLTVARNESIENCFLEVRESNQAARALYGKVGFMEVGRRPGYYPKGDRREDALVMSYSLTR